MTNNQIYDTIRNISLHSYHPGHKSHPKFFRSSSSTSLKSASLQPLCKIFPLVSRLVRFVIFFGRFIFFTFLNFFSFAVDFLLFSLYFFLFLYFSFRHAFGDIAPGKALSSFISFLVSKTNSLGAEAGDVQFFCRIEDKTFLLFTVKAGVDGNDDDLFPLCWKLV